jgi:murein tripeptide amidase MpaA
MASNLLTATIHGGSIEELRELARTRPYDFGCKPFAIPTEDGGYILPALLTQSQYDELTNGESSTRADIQFTGVPDDRAAKVTIGQGDRFGGGKVAPRGLGSRPDQSYDLGGIMNVDEIDSALLGLVNEYGIPTFALPNQSAEGSGGVGGLVGGVNPNDYHVYFTAGAHARERGGPDNLLYFIGDLLYAQKNGTGLTYGARSYSNADILRALSTGIVFFPLVNPDGVRFDQSTDSLWRKNRNPASAVLGDPASIGVDINRNYGFLWDFRRDFDPSVTSNPSLASDSPHDDTFHGTAPFSEPESSNVAWVFDQFPLIRWYVDIHSAVGDMLYSWGDDNDQTSDSTQNFGNTAWDGKRGILGIDDYKEYITQSDLGNVQAAASRVTSAMMAVEGRNYTPGQSVGLYPTSGASDDYAFSRFQVDGSKNKVYGFTMEFGYATNFYPTLAEFQQNVIDTGAGFMEFCLAAADIGLV